MSREVLSKRKVIFRSLSLLIISRIRWLGVYTLTVLVLASGNLLAQNCPPTSASGNTSCLGSEATFTATNYNATHYIDRYYWYTAQTGGNRVGTSTTNNVSSPTTQIYNTTFNYPVSGTTTLWVSASCLAIESARVPATFTLRSSSNVSINASMSPTAVCEGSNLVLTASGGSDYKWYTSSSASGPWSQIQGTTSVTPTYNTSTVYYRLTGKNDCGVGQSTSIPVGFTPKVTAANITGGVSSRCMGGETTTFGASASNATSYLWEMSPSMGQISSSGVVTWNPTFYGTAVISLTAYGCNGSQVKTTKSVTVTRCICDPPTAGGMTQCKPGEYTFTATNANPSSSNIQHWWYDQAGNRIAVTYPSNPSQGIYTSSIKQYFSASGSIYVATYCPDFSGLSTKTEIKFILNPPPSLAIVPNISPTSVCEGSTFYLTAANGTGYVWLEGASINGPWATYSPSPGSSIPSIIYPTRAGWYKLEGYNSCGEFQFSTIEVGFYPRVTTPSTPQGPLTRCIGAGTSTYTSTVSYSTGGSWSLTNAGASSINSSTGVVTWDANFTGTATVTYKATGCGNSEASRSVNVIVYPLPSNAITPSGTKKICSTCEQVITSSATGAGTTYQWKDASGNISGQTASTLTAKNAGVYSVLATQNGCSTTSVTLTLTKNKIPVANAGLDKTLDLTTPTHIITGSASDADGTTPNVLWTKISGPAVTMSAINTLNLSLSGMAVGEYVFKLTATDELLESAYDEVTIKSLPPNNYNWIKETTVSIKDQTTEAQVSALPIGSKNISWSYFDGLGRPSQVVQVQSSPSNLDIVQPIFYDQFGREQMKFLPYVSAESNGWYKVNPVGKDPLIPAMYEASTHAQYYNNTDKEIVKDATPYAKVVFEASPLNRVLKQGAPGAAWQPDNSPYLNASDKSVKLAYEANEANEVLNWSYTFPSTTLPLGLVNASNGSTPIYYLPNQLYKSRSKDEHNNEVIEYKDKEGKVILKKVQLTSAEYAQTYYIYNDFGNLVCVLPPEAVRGILKTPTSEYFNQSDLIKNGFLKRWAFRYKYDARNRMVEKQVPGSGPVQMFYDPWDRIVLTQDSIQRAKSPKEYIYTKYDALNRPIVTGLWTSTKTKDEIISELNALTASKRFESASSTQHGYTLTNSAPADATSANVLTVTYYDDYRFLGQTWFEETAGRKYTYHTGKAGYPNAYNNRVKGQVTAQKVKTLRGNNWMNSVTYYDDKYRPIRVIAENQVGGADTVSTSYDFIGKVLTTKSEHSGIKTATVTKRYQYDHAGRLIKIFNQVDSNPEVLLAENKYNELGQLVEKGIGVKDNVPIQSIDYRYNIRGWLSNINRSDLTSDSGAKNNDTNDLFGMELLYEQPTY